MSASAPDWMQNDDERELYRQLSTVFEDYCGDVFSRYLAKEQSFVAVINVIRDTLKTNRPEIDLEERPKGNPHPGRYQ